MPYDDLDLTGAEQANTLSKAREARENAYSPYSEYNVGAAVVVSTDPYDYYSGVNIESATFDMCIHAERAAIATAITNGHTEFDALFISTEDQQGEPPCSTCRQFLVEFCDDSFPIFSDCAGTDEDKVARRFRLGDVVVEPFRPDL